MVASLVVPAAAGGRPVRVAQDATRSSPRPARSTRRDDWFNCRQLRHRVHQRRHAARLRQHRDHPRRLARRHGPHRRRWPAYAIDRFGSGCSSSCSALFLLGDARPGRDHPGRDVPDRQQPGAVQHPLGAIALFLGTDIVSIYIFLQFLRSIPRELDEAAAIEGANAFTIYWRIILPLLKPAIATVVIIKGIAHLQRVLHPVPVHALARPRRHLHVAVPLQGAVRRAVGGHLGRRHPRHHPDPDRCSWPCSGSSTTASRRGDEVALFRERSGGRSGRSRRGHTRVARTSAIRSGSWRGASRPAPDSSRPGSRTPSGDHARELVPSTASPGACGRTW